MGAVAARQNLALGFRFLLKLLDKALVDAAAFVDEMTCGRGLARVHVAQARPLNPSAAPSSCSSYCSGCGRVLDHYHYKTNFKSNIINLYVKSFVIEPNHEGYTTLNS